MKKEKVAARFSVDEASEMSVEGRKAIAQWLRDCAKSLIKDGSKYSKRFSAKYLYFPNAN